MIANWQDTLIGPLIEMSQSGPGINWDMVTYPSLKQAPGQGRAADFHLLMISNTSKHKELDFEIMQYLTSDSVQLMMTRNGRMTALNNQQMALNFGANLPGFKGKNITGALKSKPSTIFPTDYDSLVTDQLGQAGVRVATGKQDINTALRQAQETADQAIDTAIKQSKGKRELFIPAGEFFSCLLLLFGSIDRLVNVKIARSYISDRFIIKFQLVTSYWLTKG